VEPSLFQTGLTVVSLALLEALLSIDNAVILALMARELKPELQKRALRYGLIGAVILRLIAVALATEVVKYPWLRAIGGAYLLWLAIKYFMKRGGSEGGSGPKKSSTQFWVVVFWIEVTDLIFAVDSILAAVAVTTDYWSIVTGGILGVILIRFAAERMIQLLNRFPKIETFAYLLVAGVGIKVLYQVAHSF
jgi:YkoY family integral membrane protein